MDLAQLVRACEETAGGEEEVSALVTYCEGRLGSPVSQEMVRALANTARTETGRERIRASSLVQMIGEADWDCGDHNTVIEVGCQWRGTWEQGFKLGHATRVHEIIKEIS